MPESKSNAVLPVDTAVPIKGPDVSTLKLNANLQNFRRRRSSVKAFISKAETALEDIKVAHQRTLHPDSTFSQIWDILIALFLIITTVVGPLEVAFIDSDVAHMNGLFWMNRIIDVGFAIDIYRQFRLAYRSRETGQWVTDPHLVALHYAKGWFTIDFISTIPWDIIEYIAVGKDAPRNEKRTSGSLKLLRLVKLVKLAKLLRLRKAIALFERMALRNNVSFSKKSLIKYFAIFFVIAHFVACGWKFMSDVVDTYNIATVLEYTAKGLPVPLYAQGWVIREQKKFSNALTGVDLYSMCVEYAMATFSMSYGTVIPLSTIERNYSIFCLIFAGCFYAYMIGAVCMSISEDEGEAMFKRNMDTLSKLCRHEKTSDELQHRLMDFYSFQKVLVLQQTYEEVLDTVTDDLRAEMKGHMFGKWADSVWYFNSSNKDISAQFKRAVCAAFRMVALPPMAVLFRMGDRADCMYVVTRGVFQKIGVREGFQGSTKINSGAIEFHRPKQYYTSWVMVNAGEWLGNEMVMQHRGSFFDGEEDTDTKRSDTVTALAYSFLQQLKAKDLWEIIKQRPSYFAPISASIRRASLGLRLENKMRHLGRLIIELKDRTGSARLTKVECEKLKRGFRANKQAKNERKKSMGISTDLPSLKKRTIVIKEPTVSGADLLASLSKESGFSNILDRVKINQNLTEANIKAMEWRMTDRATSKAAFKSGVIKTAEA